MHHFADPNIIEEGDLRHLIWKDDPSTGILIEMDYRWTPESTERRPAIIIKRNACRNDRRGWGDRRQGPPGDIYGNEHYVTFWIGSHTMFCIARTGMQVELLADEVQREFTEFGPVMARNLDLKRIQVTDKGPVSQLEEAEETFAVAVTVAYGYEERWIVRPECPTLSHISLSLLYDS